MSEEEAGERERREMERSDVEEVWVARRGRQERMCRPSAQEAWAGWRLKGQLCLRDKVPVVGERLPPLLALLVVGRTAAAGAFPWAEGLPVHVWPLWLQGC